MIWLVTLLILLALALVILVLYHPEVNFQDNCITDIVFMYEFILPSGHFIYDTVTTSFRYSIGFYRLFELDLYDPVEIPEITECLDREHCIVTIAGNNYKIFTTKDLTDNDLIIKGVVIKI